MIYLNNKGGEMMRPVNLYLKTEYSLLNSNIKIHELMSVASEKGYQVIAMTDDQNMHGAIKFYQAAHKHHLKPIIGLNVRYQFNDQTSNLLLYALDNFGYQNLMNISSRMMINEGVVELEYLARTAQGVLVVTPSDENIIFDYIARNDLTSAVNHLNTLTSIYYDFYLE